MNEKPDDPIQSRDYEPGKRGWAIWADGRAEFNNLVVRSWLR